MRLHRLRIQNFKNLKDFTIEFDKDELTTVLIGRNGTGKSNLVEALIIIFRDLDLSKKPPFSYELEYECRRHQIRVRAQTDVGLSQSEVIIDGKRVPYSRFARLDSREYLPKYVFAYYSGASQRLEKHFDTHQRRFYDDLLRGVDDPFRPLFYARPIHSQFVLLPFFSSDDNLSRVLLETYMDISGLHSVVFDLRQPDWSSTGGDPRFWNARGVVADFLDKLFNCSSHPVRRSERERVGFRKTRTREHLYLLLESEQKLKDLANACGDSIQFFKMLESTYMSELLHEVDIKVKKKDSRQAIAFRELSEGEQQLLAVLGLLKFTKDEESLFLLDEPDTQLNPVWKLDYLDMVERYVGANKTSHVLLCTHDPLLIGGMLSTQVRIFRRDADTGRITTDTPEQDPRGMGVAALLTSELFGLSTTLDTSTQKKLDQKRQLYVKSLETKLTAKEQQDMQQLSDELGALDFTRTVRDPLYDKFVRATMSIEEFRKPVLSAADKKRQDKIAKQVIEQILQEEKQSGS